MNLRWLQAFVDVAESGSIAEAGTVSRTPATTVAQWVRSLEDELGLVLFHRAGAGLTLTSAGELLVSHARTVLAVAEEAATQATGRPSALSGLLRVTAHDALAVTVLPPLLGELRRRHPQTRVRISRLPEDTDPADPIREDRCDLALVGLPVPVAAGLTLETLGEHEYVLVAPPDPPLPPGQLGLAQLPDLPLVSMSRTTAAVRTFSDRLHRERHLRAPAAIVDHREAHVDFVLSGMGLAFLERAAAQDAAARGAQVRALRPPVTMAFGVVYDPGRLSPLARVLLRLARVTDFAGSPGYQPEQHTRRRG